jgi:hypothetical protein
MDVDCKILEITPGHDLLSKAHSLLNLAQDIYLGRLFHQWLSNWPI